MKNYFLSFVFAVLVVLAGFGLRRTLATGSHAGSAPTVAAAIGSSPIPQPPGH